MLRSSVVLKSDMFEGMPYMLFRIRKDPSLVGPISERYDRIIRDGGLAHRVAALVLSLVSPLRSHMEVLASTGSVSAELSAALLPYEWALLDETCV